jgi:dehydrogenase/reductase SDR family protein 7B
MEVNCFSIVNLTQGILPYIKCPKIGHVIIISRVACKFGFYLHSGYSAPKHVLHSFFDSFWLETEKDGIKTLIVCPGKIIRIFLFSTPINYGITVFEGCKN